MAGPVEVPLQALDADFARQLALALTAAAAGPADALPVGRLPPPQVAVSARLWAGSSGPETWS